MITPKRSTFGHIPRRDGRSQSPKYARQQRNIILKMIAITVTFILALKYILYDTDPLSARLSHGPAKAMYESVRYTTVTDGASCDDSATGDDPVADVNQVGAMAVKHPKSKPSPSNRDFKVALHRVFDLLPNKQVIKHLLSPIQGNGEARLRETGIRAKAFRSYFDAWEKLHLVIGDNKEAYFRNDVIQDLLQNTPNKNIAYSIHTYEQFRIFLEDFAAFLFPYIIPDVATGDSTGLEAQMGLHAKVYKGGRGIVLSAGNRQAPFLLTSIPSLRRLGCELPIEIMYLGDGDLSPENRAKLEQLGGVVTRDVKVKDEGWKLGGWAVKPFAILLSSFREVIFIDADSLFFKNPEVLFEEDAYKRTGALFFRDRVLFPEDKRGWLQEILPEPISKSVKESRFWTGISGHMQESGVVVVDKWRHFVSMLMVTRMNGPDRDGDKSKGIKGIYDMVYGDKETFWLGWELVGDLDYAFHQGDVGVLGQPSNSKNSGSGSQQQHEICAPQLLHLDLEGKPLWFNGWILVNKFEEDVTKRKANVFTHYLRENPNPVYEPNVPHQWQLKENNNACLSAGKSYAFTEAEKGTLDSIMKDAEVVGAYKKK
ncbi:hypothetical protein TWF694_005537 [Orbilia ellipsospora]|uniref:Alpha-1,3-mannosyltransferase n=1 Tax=Orbilia ellipsospora TaxID=2528407 RepID=A0AAV9WZF7_9PEZI